MTADAKPYHHGDLARALIDAAAAMVREGGPEAVSVRRAAKRAGVSPGAPFRHFASRDALLAAVAGQAMARLAQAVEAEETPRGADALTRIEAIGRGYLTWALSDPELFRLVSRRELVALDPQARALNDGIRDRMTALLEEARADGALREGLDPGLALLSCRATVYGLARMHVDGHLPEWSPDGDPAALLERGLRQFILSLRAQDGSGPGGDA